MNRSPSPEPTLHGDAAARSEVRSEAPTGADLARQIVVISAVVFMIIAAMVGTGFFGGTNVRDLQGGALDADATVLAPATQAFSIWSVVYLLTIAYAVWQALPSQRGRARQRRAGWWIAATAVLNGGWLLAAQFLTLPLTVVAIVLLLVVLGVTLRRLVAQRPESPVDLLLMDGAVGIHLGWVSLATVANVTAWLAADVDALVQRARAGVAVEPRIERRHRLARRDQRRPEHRQPAAPGQHHQRGAAQGQVGRP